MPLTKTLFSRSALSSSFIDKAGSSVSSSFHTRGASALSSSFIGKTGTAVSASFMDKAGAAVSASFVTNAQSGSFASGSDVYALMQATGSLVGRAVASASFIDKAGAAVSGTFATRASVSSSLTQGNESVQFDQVTGSTALFTGRMTVGEVFTQYVSSSVLIESSGSTKLGNESTDLHQVTGSMSILSGSLTLTGNVSGSSISTSSFGSAIFMGNVNIGTTSSNPSASVATSGSDANLTISGSIFPEGDNNHDLGSANYRWRYIYTTDLKLSNEGTGGNSVDGTEGNWTVEEGEEDLFVTNKKSGKKFRIKLEEIE